MQPVTFSPVGEAEIAIVRQLAHEIWWACYPGIITDAQIEYMLEWMYSESALRADLARGVRYEIVHFAGHPSGYIAYEESTPGQWKLQKLYLLPGFQGQGLGQAALQHISTAVSAAGGHSLLLTVNKNNTRAIRAYERAGFQNRRSVVNDIGGGFVMDDFVFERELPAPVSV